MLSMSLSPIYACCDTGRTSMHGSTQTVGCALASPMRWIHAAWISYCFLFRSCCLGHLVSVLAWFVGCTTLLRARHSDTITAGDEVRIIWVSARLLLGFFLDVLIAIFCFASTPLLCILSYILFMVVRFSFLICSLSILFPHYVLTVYFPVRGRRR